MQINLKQSEIEQALKAYVSHQGISLYGKDVTISFTAGRRESGISAEVTIEDIAIPGMDDIQHVPEAVQAPVVALKAVKESPEVEAPVEAEAVTVEVDAAGTKITSLFS